MTCPHCRESIDPVAASTGQIVRTLLRDWRVWVGGFVLMACGGILAHGLGLPPAAGTGGAGAFMGFLIAKRMGRSRRCPRCQAVFQVGATPAT